MGADDPVTTTSLMPTSALGLRLPGSVLGAPPPLSDGRCCVTGTHVRCPIENSGATDMFPPAFRLAAGST